MTPHAVLDSPFREDVFTRHQGETERRAFTFVKGEIVAHAENVVAGSRVREGQVVVGVTGDVEDYASVI